MTALALLSASAMLFQANAETVACMGKIVPGVRISRLAAESPNGSQAVVKEVKVSKGDSVAAGTVIAVIQGADRAEAALDRAKKQLETAKSAAAIKILQQKNLIADLEGAWTQNQKVLDEKDPPRREREQIEYEQEALSRRISQAKAMLPLVEKNENAIVAEASAAVSEAEKFYGAFFVKTPFAGEVVEVHVNPGEAAGQDGIAEIADTRTMFVEAEVYVSDISKVKPGDPAEILSDALKGKKFTGKVVQVSGYVKSNKIFSSDPSDYSNLRVVIAKIKLDDPASFKSLIGSQVSVRIGAK